MLTTDDWSALSVRPHLYPPPMGSRAFRNHDCPSCAAPWWDDEDPRPQVYVRTRPCECPEARNQGRGCHTVTECAKCGVDHSDPPCSAPSEDVAGIARARPSYRPGLQTPDRRAGRLALRRADE